MVDLISDKSKSLGSME